VWAGVSKNSFKKPFDASSRATSAPLTRAEILALSLNVAKSERKFGYLDPL